MNVLIIRPLFGLEKKVWDSRTNIYDFICVLIRFFHTAHLDSFVRKYNIKVAAFVLTSKAAEYLRGIWAEMCLKHKQYEPLNLPWNLPTKYVARGLKVFQFTVGLLTWNLLCSVNRFSQSHLKYFWSHTHTGCANISTKFVILNMNLHYFLNGLSVFNTLNEIFLACEFIYYTFWQISIFLKYNYLPISLTKMLYRANRLLS